MGPLFAGLLELLLLIEAAGEAEIRTSFYIPENSPRNTVVGKLVNFIPHLQQTKGVRLELHDLTGKNLQTPFYVDQSTYAILVNDQSLLNREEICPECSGNDAKCLLKFGVSATIVKVAEPVWITVDIVVTDVNDNEPYFLTQALDQSTCLKFELSEASPINTRLKLPGAADLDSEEFGHPIYSLRVSVNQEAKPPFDLLVSGEDLWLTQVQALDYEAAKQHFIDVVACDQGQPPLCATLPICIAVFDENDNSPTFQHHNQTVAVREDLPVGAIVMKFEASDLDDGDNGRVHYRIVAVNVDSNSHRSLHQSFSTFAGSDNQFRLNPLSGQLFVNRPLEGSKTFALLVEARDSPESSWRSDQTWATIHVIDVNNHAPDILLEAVSGDAEVQVQLWKLLADRNQDFEALLCLFENNDAPIDLAHVIVSDRDAGINARASCDLHNDLNELVNLTLTQVNSGTNGKLVFRLSLNSVMDHEQLPESRIVPNLDPDSSGLTADDVLRGAFFTITCRDSGDPPMTANLTAYLAILDRNEYAPEFSQATYAASVLENRPAGETLLKFHMSDLDEATRPLARVSLQLEEHVRPFFAIDESVGALLTAQPLDAEKQSVFEFRVWAINTGLDNVTRKAVTHVQIEVKNVNDNPPRFLPLASGPPHFSVSESAPVGTLVGVVEARDEESSNTTQIPLQFLLTGCTTVKNSRYINPEHWPFELAKNVGTLVTRLPLDREQTDQYHLTIEVWDFGSPKSLTTTGTFAIQVKDENDNPPVWTFPREPEDMDLKMGVAVPFGRFLTRLSATDADAAANGLLTYAIEDTHNRTSNLTWSSLSARDPIFAINERNGQLFRSNYSQPEMREGDVLKLTLNCRDNGNKPRSSRAVLLIHVKEGSQLPMSHLVPTEQADQADSFSRGLVGDNEQLVDLQDAYNSPGSFFKLTNSLLLMIAVPATAILLLFSLLVFGLACFRKRRNRSRKSPNSLTRVSGGLEFKEAPEPGRYHSFSPTTAPAINEQNAALHAELATSSLSDAQSFYLAHPNLVMKPVSDLEISSADSGQGPSEEDTSYAKNGTAVHLSQLPIFPHSDAATMLQPSTESGAGCAIHGFYICSISDTQTLQSLAGPSFQD